MNETDRRRVKALLEDARRNLQPDRCSFNPIHNDLIRRLADALEAEAKASGEVERIARDLRARYGADGFQAAEAILRVLRCRK